MSKKYISISNDRLSHMLSVARKCYKEEQEKEIQSTILYNYDALWMSAIHKAFPEQTTNTQCGYGKMELL